MELTIIIPDEFAKELLDKIQISRSEPLELKKKSEPEKSEPKGYNALQERLVKVAREKWKISEVDAIHSLDNIASFDYGKDGGFIEWSESEMTNIAKKIKDGELEPFG